MRNIRNYHPPLWILFAVLLVALVVAPRGQTQPATKPAEAPAEVTVIVPADAEVFLDDAPTKLKGTERIFVSPPLEVGKKFHYEILARWKADGKTVEDKRKVEVTGGAHVRVDFTKAGPKPVDTVTAEEAQKIATEAYVYGYPLVMMDVSRQVMTAVPKPTTTAAPIDQFNDSKEFPDATFTSVVSPNADTLYSFSWLDLSKEPMVLSLPDTGDRYYLMQMLDGWTNVFASPGTRTTGNKKGDYVVVGPHFTGKLPDGVKEIKSPTSLVWIIGRTQTNGKADFAAVHVLKAQYKLIPLSAWGKDYVPPAEVPVDPKVDVKTPPVEQVAKMDGTAFFTRLATLLKDNPPAEADKPMVEKLARIGIVPGQAFDPAKLDPAVVKGLERGATAGREKILAEAKKPQGKVVNGWDVMGDLGRYGTNYLFRAVVALVGLGANLSEDAIYPHAKVDADGKPLTGENRYVIHFPKGQLPPVGAFWSITLYNSKQFFVANPLDRFAIGDRDKLKFNDDGSLTLYVQNESPGKDRESNWLPAPKDSFNLIMRLYWPKESVVNGSWMPPPVKRVN